MDLEYLNLVKHSVDQYWSVDFWNARYARDTSHFEWLAPWSFFKSSILEYIGARTTALDIGCGTSKLCRDLVDEGFQKVIGMDFSPVLIQKLSELPKSDREIELQVGDCTKMKFLPKYFDAVFDKGTLDCVMSGPSGSKLTRQALIEVRKILKLNGVYVLVSRSSPEIWKDTIESVNGLKIATIASMTKNEDMIPDHNVYVVNKIKDG